jgi:AcrR family transcriptional regulator
LLDGMVAAAARYGYGDASVARAIKLAGVSRATFYEHFANKEECLLAACAQLAETVESDLARETDDPPSEALGAVLAGSDRDPAGARVLLIESLAGGAELRAEQERLLAFTERGVETYLQHPPPGAPILGITGAAALGGVSSVMSVRLFRGETGRLGELRDDLLTWIGSYAVPDGGRRLDRAGWAALGERFAASRPQPVDAPRGSAAAHPPAGSGEQRQIVEAVARLAMRRGYTAMTVADVVAEAPVSREAFYQHFRGKDDAYQAAQAFALEASVATVAARFFGEQSWPERVWSGLEAMVDFTAERLDLACVDLVESYAAGQHAIRRSIENRTSFTLFLEDGYRQRPAAAALPRLCSEAIGGAIWEMLRRRVSSGHTEGLGELIPQVVYLALAPFLGPVEALELVEARCASG